MPKDRIVPSLSDEAESGPRRDAPTGLPQASPEIGERRPAASELPTANAGLPDVESAGLPTTQAKAKWAAAAVVVGAAFLWSYWPMLLSLQNLWSGVADYSHGYLVAPLALFFLWARRDRMPTPRPTLSWAGLILVAVSLGMRFVAARYYLESVDGWSIVPWFAGVIWLFFGRAFFWWTLPSVMFLLFMVRIPFRLELGLSLPLQSIATKLSCWTLQLLGQPAISEGHVIYLGDNVLEIAQACSGLRIFIGIGALAYAYVVIVRRTWWEKALLLASVIPIALIANATRVVATGLLYQYVSGEAARKFSHDIAGGAMILYAAMLFALVLWYLSKLVYEVEPMEMGAVVRNDRT